MNLQSIELRKLLILDIETIPIKQHYSDLSDSYKTLWKHKFSYKSSSELDLEKLYKDKAGIFAEFGKVIQISVAYLAGTHEPEWRVMSFYGDYESKLIDRFFRFVDSMTKKKGEVILAGHNIKEFDIPYLARRALINNLKLPKLFQLSGLKPWEVNMVDTFTLWKFGDYKHFTSLDLLAQVFGLPSPKNNISGADVARVFYEEKDKKKISDYCNRDVITCAKVIWRMMGRKIKDFYPIHFA